MADVTFHFDPLCPWTWRASRWLVNVAEARGLDVEWRSFSLAALNEGKEIPEAYRAPMAASSRALRLVEALHADGRDEDAAAFYTELGSRVHEAGAPLSGEVVAEAVKAAGVEDAAAALDDESWDAAVHAAHDRAFSSAGPDIGSPVIILEGAKRGLHGPILSEIPGVDDSVTLWDSIVPLFHSPIFFEVKRGRG
ncbi:DsbA family protein [Microtetraspora sp. AC03309]|uniref:DsbA family protein n=1 Tax=Microtetraspora sp. AC03309 TaxID=2779376 RepID=UPI001E2E0539|nr:DsbA family protein [Microtetraspora sp. AC03309]MCC5581125.1 DsbA family protein [Microtetraspora sp. AC03309]